MDLAKIKFVASAFRTRMADVHQILLLDFNIHVWTNEREIWVSYVNDEFRVETRIPADISMITFFDDFRRAVMQCCYMKTTYHLPQEKKDNIEVVPLFSK